MRLTPIEDIDLDNKDIGREIKILNFKEKGLWHLEGEEMGNMPLLRILIRYLHQ